MRKNIYVRILIEIVDSCSFHFAVKCRWHCNLIAFSLVGVSRKYKRKWWKFSPRGCRNRTRWKFTGSSCCHSGAWWSHLYNRHKFAAIKYPWLRAWSHVKSLLITRSAPRSSSTLWLPTSLALCFAKGSVSLTLHLSNSHSLRKMRRCQSWVAGLTGSPRVSSLHKEGSFLLLHGSRRSLKSSGQDWKTRRSNSWGSLIGWGPGGCHLEIPDQLPSPWPHVPWISTSPLMLIFTPCWTSEDMGVFRLSTVNIIRKSSLFMGIMLGVMG